MIRGKLSALMCVLFLTACKTAPELPPIDVSQPGWQVQQGQAVWKPKTNGPELSGELLWASHPDGRFLLQFLKTPITLVEAQGSQAGWQISFPPQERSFSSARQGRLALPSRLGWLHLAAALQERTLAPEWTFARRANRSWQLSNARTGETIEGYLTQ